MGVFGAAGSIGAIVAGAVTTAVDATALGLSVGSGIYQVGWGDTEAERTGGALSVVLAPLDAYGVGAGTHSAASGIKKAFSGIEEASEMATSKFKRPGFSKMETVGMASQGRLEVPLPSGKSGINSGDTGDPTPSDEHIAKHFGDSRNKEIGLYTRSNEELADYSYDETQDDDSLTEQEAKQSPKSIDYPDPYSEKWSDAFYD